MQLDSPGSLGRKVVAELIPAAPFHFDATFHKPDHFPAPDNCWRPGVRWQTMRWQSRPLGLKFEDRGALDRPRIALSIWSAEALEEPFLDGLLAEIEFRYDLHLDLADFYRRFQRDPHLGPVIDRWRGMRPLNFSSLYEYLIIAIVLQNATVRRSVQMMQALFERYGTLLSYDGQGLYCFWEPAALDAAGEPELRALKVGYRAKALKRVSRAFVSGEIDELALRRQGREARRAALLGLYGVGPASVGYILTDVFHHLDELDHISPWEQKIYSKLFFDTEPDAPVPVADLRRFFEARFSPYKMLAVHYFWEDLFWKRRTERVDWLEKLIRL